MPEGLAAHFGAYSHIVYEYISSTTLSMWGSVLISVFWPSGFRRYARVLPRCFFQFGFPLFEMDADLGFQPGTISIKRDIVCERSYVLR